MAELKKLVSYRGYVKGGITRLSQQSFVADSFESLVAKRDRLIKTFAEYDEYNKLILALDPSDSENYSEIEDKYYSVISTLNIEIDKKQSKVVHEPTVQGNDTKLRLPTIQIDKFTDNYTKEHYQLERDVKKYPTVQEILDFLEKRALALENCEHVAQPKKAVVNVTSTSSGLVAT